MNIQKSNSINFSSLPSFSLPAKSSNLDPWIRTIYEINNLLTFTKMDLQGDELIKVVANKFLMQGVRIDDDKKINPSKYECSKGDLFNDNVKYSYCKLMKAKSPVLGANLGVSYKDGSHSIWFTAVGNWPTNKTRFSRREIEVKTLPCLIIGYNEFENWPNGEFVKTPEEHDFDFHLLIKYRTVAFYKDISSSNS